jgi:hypothetical protein
MSEATAAAPQGGEDFALPNHDAVREDNWQEMVEQNVKVLIDCVALEELPKRMGTMQGLWGVEHILTGDAFDETEQRPLHLKPGRGIYVRLGDDAQLHSHWEADQAFIAHRDALWEAEARQRREQTDA